MNFRLIKKSTGKLIALAALISLASCKKDISKASQDSPAATLSDSSTAADNMYNDVLNNAFVGFSDNASVWETLSNPHSRRKNNQLFHR